ncbi:isochorismatase domain-containing protein 2-like [Centruroides sculpturatus]|uniref:isochorismatase domain-containing protein 2-like n=1 Tax=Centruroides sculpturatus TaxID=218467 RepID=UPI000C6D9BEC|nr:isochorismatase domain-containing protein 2-like [Centruroides sculpturatus]
MECWTRLENWQPYHTLFLSSVLRKNRNMAVCRVGQLLPKQTCVFLCDMQEKFRPTIKYFNEIVQVSSRILKGAKALDIPVIVTEQYRKGLGPTVSELGIADYADIKPFHKTQFSMLTDDVIKTLKSKSDDIKSVVLCGIETHVCIQGTTLSLIKNGYDVHVVVDACSSRSMIDR